MPILNRIAAFHDDMTAWRRDLHAHPEIGFEEVRTSAFVAGKLAEFGIEVHRGLARTGVVGVLRGKREGGAIGLRADMDALPMQEENEFAHASRHPGKMHGCGHDGHTTMLLGAARYLAETRNFAGTVHFIFQPAEEGLGGGRLMVEEGLFESFPCQQVFGMHNWPDMPVGTFGVHSSAVMAAADRFEIVVAGKGGHAAMPHHTIDPVVVAAQIVTALQSLVSRTTDPVDTAVVSITTIHGGTTFNVIPREVVLTGTARAFRPATRDHLEAGIARIAQAIAAAHGAQAAVDYRRCYPPTINHADEANLAARVAAEVVGAGNVSLDPQPSMGAEDFAFMLERKPGCYVWLGQGSGPNSCMVHNPRYDFNDEVLPIGASYWAALVETALAPASR
ncbi:MAG: amidohydrolase [Azospirillum sp.]|nr:amidohydrolase [Azospirillum sp.]